MSDDNNGDDCTATRAKQRVKITARQIQKVHLMPVPVNDRVLELSSSSNRLHELIAKISKNDASPSQRWIRQKQWRMIQLRAQLHPQEANTSLHRRFLLQSCLHVACTKKPPVAVVRALVQAAAGDYNNDNTTQPAETTPPDAQQQRLDKHGRTPLALAIANNASLDVIDYLLELGRMAANKKTTPAVRIVDNRGFLPLHMACSGYDCGQLELIQKLITEYPEAVNMEQVYGNTTTRDNHRPTPRTRREIQGNRYNARNTPLSYSLETRAPLPVVQLLIRYMKQQQQDDRDFTNTDCPLIVALNSRNGGVSPDVIHFLIREFPNAIHQSRSMGRLPFWIAIQRNQPLEYPLSVYRALAPTPEIILDTGNKSVNTNSSTTALHQLLSTTSSSGGTTLGPQTFRLVRHMVNVAPSVANLHAKYTKTSPLKIIQRRFYNLSLVEGRRSQPRFNLGGLWHVQCILLIAAYYGDFVLASGKTLDYSDGDNVEHGIFVLHAAIAMGGPLEVVQTILLRYPHQVALRDCLGNYPFHLALDPECPFERNRRDLIFLLLHHFSEAADPSVLHMAAKVSHKIHDNVWDKLIMAHPMALRMTSERLLPFQIAAVQKEKEGTNSDQRSFQYTCGDAPIDEDLYQVNSIYKLLLAAPELVGTIG